jgi:hypothetical protein
MTNTHTDQHIAKPLDTADMIQQFSDYSSHAVRQKQLFRLLKKKKRCVIQRMISGQQIRVPRDALHVVSIYE